ncbi:MAG TPA: hypothetical protein VGQ92_26715 [Actinoplanes sp.]|nr:hypothetical protein [Actinoplanes sp.]
MTYRYAHLGVYSDWVRVSPGPRARASRPAAERVRRLVRDVLAGPGEGSDLPDGDVPQPAGVRVERQWTADGLAGQELSYSVGYGPRTRAWLLKPANAAGPLPGVLALHGHDGFKYYGKEKIADGPEPPPPVVAALRASHYEGRAFANDLAREGLSSLFPTSSAGAAADSRCTRCQRCCRDWARPPPGWPHRTQLPVKCLKTSLDTTQPRGTTNPCSRSTATCSAPPLPPSSRTRTASL